MSRRRVLCLQSVRQTGGVLTHMSDWLLAGRRLLVLRKGCCCLILMDVVLLQCVGTPSLQGS